MTPKKVNGGSGSISLSFNSKSATSMLTYDDSLKIQVTGL